MAHISNTARQFADSRLPSLDGWRAVFIGMVLYSHFAQPATITGLASISKVLHDGGLAVRGFFVLSGFLITHLLLQEAAACERIDFRKFYVRRALRIFPVYFLFIAAIAISQTSGIVKISLGSWISTVFFYANFRIGLGEWTMFHLWSLAIEQQFYLLWPWAFVILKPWKAVRPALVAFALLFLFTLGFRALAGWITFWSDHYGIQVQAGEPLFWYTSLAKTHFAWLFQGSSTFLFLDTLAIGCLAAILIFHHRPTIENFSSRKLFFVLLISLIAIASPITWAPENRWLRGTVYLFAYPLQAFGIAMLISASIVFQKSLLTKLLSARSLVFLGTISYSVYIWQQPFTNIWFKQIDPTARVLLVLMLATVSYIVVETPCNRLRSGFRSSHTPNSPISASGT